MEEVLHALFPPALEIIRESPNATRYLIISTLTILFIYYSLDRIVLSSTRSGRSRSWTLGCVVALLMTLMSIPCIADFYFNNGFTQVSGDSYEFQLFMCCFFIAFVCWDLVLGVLYYRNQLHLVMAWIHHIGYFVLLLNLIRHDKMQPFCISAVMELPTFILGLGSIWPHLRMDLGFGVSFFVTRILWHLVLIHQMYYHHAYPWWMVMAGILPLHLFWFNGWFRWYYYSHYSLVKMGADTEEDSDDDDDDGKLEIIEM